MKATVPRNLLIANNQRVIKRCLSPINIDDIRLQDIDHQNLLPSIDNVWHWHLIEMLAFLVKAFIYIIIDEYKNYNEFYEHKGSNKSFEPPIVFTKQMKELCTKINIKIRNKWRILINDSKAPCYMKANTKLRRKFRIWSISPDRQSAVLAPNLSWVSQDKVTTKQQLLIDRIMKRERLMRNLNIDINNKEMTHKVFDLWINLKYMKQIVA